MGADLYIHSVYQPNKAQHLPRFEAAVAKRDNAKTEEAKQAAQAEVSEAYEAIYATGYFRDSYNSSSVLWVMDLSWWRDVTPLQNKKGELRGPSIRKLIAMIEAKPITAEIIQRIWDGEKDELGCDPSESPAQCLEYFTEKRARLLAFLRQALELKQPIDASL